MSKLKDTLLNEAKVSDEDKRKASLDAAAYAFRIRTIASEFKDLRKKHQAVLGKQFKKAQEDLVKVGNFLEDAAMHLDY